MLGPMTKAKVLQAKLDQLVSDCGFIDVDDLIESSLFDSVSPGICLNPGCDYSTDVEPDCVKGYCEVCGTQTVCSGLVLAGII